jgi:hypothetical protein
MGATSSTKTAGRYGDAYEQGQVASFFPPNQAHAHPFIQVVESQIVCVCAEFQRRLGEWQRHQQAPIQRSSEAEIEVNIEF